MINIAVIDENGLGVDSVTILVYKLSDQSIYDVSEYNEPGGSLNQRGEYTIFHDGYLQEVQRKLEVIVVQGERDTLKFMQEFVVTGDDCHVFKITGPDTVLLE